jgi:hypothetical protein
MRRISSVLFFAATLSAVACKGNDAKVDDALNGDLSMASRPYNQLDSVTAAERAAQTSGAQRTTTTRTRSSYSSGSSSRASAPAPSTHVEKHGGRDAAIGAGAGAILGAATSKNKVKGGIIGAAAGGILGAVIGNNVDKKTVKD